MESVCEIYSYNPNNGTVDRLPHRIWKYNNIEYGSSEASDQLIAQCLCVVCFGKWLSNNPQCNAVIFDANAQTNARCNRASTNPLKPQKRSSSPFYKHGLNLIAAWKD